MFVSTTANRYVHVTGFVGSLDATFRVLTISAYAKSILARGTTRSNVCERDTAPSCCRISFANAAPRLKDEFFMRSYCFGLVSGSSEFLLRSRILKATAGSVLPKRGIIPICRIGNLRTYALNSLCVPKTRRRASNSLEDE